MGMAIGIRKFLLVFFSPQDYLPGTPQGCPVQTQKLSIQAAALGLQGSL